MRSWQGEGPSGLTLPLASYKPESASSLWQPRAPVPYMFLAVVLNELEATRSRLAKELILTNAFRSMLSLQAPAADIEASCYMLAPCDTQGRHRLRPDHDQDSKPLRIPQASIVAAVVKAAGSTKEYYEKVFQGLQEPGQVALALCQRAGRGHQEAATPSLTAVGVREALLELAEISGTGSSSTKAEFLAGLLTDAVGSEVKWLVRTCVANLKAGISLEAAVLPALSAACLIHRTTGSELPTKMVIKKEQEAVRSSFARHPDVGKLLEGLLGTTGDRRSVRVTRPTLRPGVPVAPMLAKPCTSIDEVLQRMTKAGRGKKAEASVQVTAQHKYDGQRAQIHRTEDGEVRIFSRMLDDMTYKYPDAVAAVQQSTRHDEAFILDAEIVPVVGAASRLGTFQSLSTRKRTNVTEENAASSSVAVKLFLFDLLYFGDESLDSQPLLERRELLHAQFAEESDVVALVDQIDVEIGQDDAYQEAHSVLDSAMQRAVADGCEGLMVKRLDAAYKLSTTRSDYWLKLKKDYMNSMGDTLDLVPIGGWRGTGRKSGWVSAWLMATFDPQSGTLGSVCRMGSGLNDQFHKDSTIKYLGAELGKTSGRSKRTAPAPAPGSGLLRSTPAPGVETAEKPTFWFEPSEVWEVCAADITVSPKHMSARGLVDPERGLSLRFPRFVRTREDKSVSDATTPEQVAEMFQQQTQHSKKPSRGSTTGIGWD